MNSASAILWAVVFAFSLFGLFHHVRERSGLEPDFIPVFVFSSIGMIVFIAGLANVMPLAVGALISLGMVFGIRTLFRRRTSRALLSAGLAFTAGLALVSVPVFHDRLFLHYDNFSHWALVARTIIENDHLPNFSDKIIRFQAYPPGSACFIYFVGKIFGSRDSVMMFAQALLIFAGFGAFFPSVRRNRIAGWSLISVFFLYALGSNVTPFDLLVDTLLPILGLAALLISHKYRHDIRKTAVFTTPILCYLITVKNSGAFFVALTVVYAAVAPLRRWRFDRLPSRWRSLAMMALAPAFTGYLWTRHVELVFASGGVSKHAMSIENYRSMLADKSPEQIGDIAQAFVMRLADGRVVPWIAVALIALIIVARLMKIRPAVGAGTTLGLFAGSYITYQVGVLAMYIFSMPLKEADHLAGFRRYDGSITIFVAGIAVWYAIAVLDALDFKTRRRVSGALFASLLLPLSIFAWDSGAVREAITPPDSAGTFRSRLEVMITTHGVRRGRSCLVLHGDSRSGYVKYVSRYCLASHRVKTVDVNHLSPTMKASGYDYIIVLDRSPEADAFLQRQFPNRADQDVIEL